MKHPPITCATTPVRDETLRTIVYLFSLNGNTVRSCHKSSEEPPPPNGLAHHRKITSDGLICRRNDNLSGKRTTKQSALNQAGSVESNSSRPLQQSMGVWTAVSAVARKKHAILALTGRGGNNIPHQGRINVMVFTLV